MLMNPAIGRPSNIALRRLDGGHVAPGNDTRSNTATISPEVGKAIGETVAGIIKGVGSAVGGGGEAAPPPPAPSMIPGVSDKTLAVAGVVAAVVVLAALVWYAAK